MPEKNYLQAKQAVTGAYRGFQIFFDTGLTVQNRICYFQGVMKNVVRKFIITEQEAKWTVQDLRYGTVNSYKTLNGAIKAMERNDQDLVKRSPDGIKMVIAKRIFHTKTQIGSNLVKVFTGTKK